MIFLVIYLLVLVDEWCGGTYVGVEVWVTTFAKIMFLMFNASRQCWKDHCVWNEHHS
jgi:hypothetical protein